MRIDMQPDNLEQQMLSKLVIYITAAISLKLELTSYGSPEWTSFLYNSKPKSQPI